jgi:hypothetical protein
MKQLLFYFILIITLCTSINAKDYNYELTPYIGKNFMDNDYRMGDSTTLGLNFDTFFTSNFGLRVGYERLLNMEVDNSDDAKMNRFYLNGIARYNIPYYTVTPYMFAGFGHESCEDDDCPSTWFRDVGMGVGIDLTCNFKISPEVKVVNRSRNCGKDCDNLTDVVATIGATYLFGSPKVVEKVVRVNVPVEKIITKEVRVEVPVVVQSDVCKVPLKFKDRCDNSYYIQIASSTLCPKCTPKIRDKKLLRKLQNSGYNYEAYPTTTKDGARVAKVLIGPYRCKRDAYSELCHIKSEFKCDAFIYSK